jgi:hypothetical protein
MRKREAGQAITEFSLVLIFPEDQWVAVRDDLRSRLPPRIYWTALLPLTHETVGDGGNQQLAEDLAPCVPPSP